MQIGPENHLSYQQFKKKSNQELPVIENCDGCGACCMEQESPPGYLWILLHGQSDDPMDLVRFNHIPGPVMDELKAYVETIRSQERHPNDGVCIWFDEETRKCKHYELRPSICRDIVKPGDDGCRRWREAYGV